MFKKYLPFLFLIASALLFIYVKMNQVGVAPHRNNNTTDHFTIPAVLPPSDNPNRVEDGFDRRNNHLLYSKHARCRMECRHIDESEVKEILESGTINYSKIEDDGRGKSFPLEGVTHDKQHVRIVFAPKEDGMLVVTCIDLDRDWPCECR